MPGAAPCRVDSGRDPVTATDAALAKLGRKRDLRMTVPNFSSALFLVARSDLVASLPERLITLHCASFGLVGSPLPFPMSPGMVVAVTTRAAPQDAGVAWLIDLVCRTMSGSLAA